MTEQRTGRQQRHAMAVRATWMAISVHEARLRHRFDRAHGGPANGVWARTARQFERQIVQIADELAAAGAPA